MLCRLWRLSLNFPLIHRASRIEFGPHILTKMTFKNDGLALIGLDFCLLIELRTDCPLWKTTKDQQRQLHRLRPQDQLRIP